MSRDHKLGMLAGVIGVVVIAVFYHQRANSTPPAPPPNAAVQALSTPADPLKPGDPLLRP